MGTVLHCQSTQRLGLRGLYVNLPVLAEGQQAYTTDSLHWYFGTSGGNKKLTNWGDPLFGVASLSGTLPATNTFHNVTTTISGAVSTAAYMTGALFTMNYNPTSSNSGWYMGVASTGTLSQTGLIDRVYGVFSNPFFTGSGSINFMYGYVAEPTINGNGYVTEIMGGIFKPQFFGTGNASLAYGIWAAPQLTSIGTPQYSTSVMADFVSTGGAATLQNTLYYGKRPTISGGSTLTYNYGIYLEDQSTIGGSLSEAIHTAGGNWHLVNGGLTIDKGATNNDALILTSSGAGWGSGVRLLNTGSPGGFSDLFVAQNGGLNINNNAGSAITLFNGNINIATTLMTLTGNNLVNGNSRINGNSGMSGTDTSANVVLKSTTTPSSPTAGQVYFDGTHFQGWNGTAWKQLDN